MDKVSEFIDNVEAMKFDILSEKVDKMLNETHIAFRSGYDRALNELEKEIEDICFGFKASQGNLVRVDVVESVLLDRIKKLKELEK